MDHARRMPRGSRIPGIHSRRSTMAKFTKKLGARAKAAVDDVETRILAAEGKRSIRAKVERVKKVTRKAAKAGAIAGAVVAASVVMSERKKRRKLTS
jgi:hypothetical protein